MPYLLLKQLHVACAILSIAGFAARGLLMLRDSPLLQSRFARIAPHVVDTVLLASAIALAWMSGQYPFAQSWLTAKVVALVAYIGLGAIALGPGRSRPVKLTAFLAAMATVLYITSVAILRNPEGFLFVMHQFDADQADTRLNP